MIVFFRCSPLSAWPSSSTRAARFSSPRSESVKGAGSSAAEVPDHGGGREQRQAEIEALNEVDGAAFKIKNDPE